MTAPTLAVEGLTAYLGATDNPVRAVDGVSFEIEPGQTFAMLGESGCGKSMSALTLMRLLPASGRIIQGSVRFGGQDLLRLSEARMREIRGAGISMIFQEPMTSLNPVLKVGQQIVESLHAHRSLRGRAARDETAALLNAVGIPNPRFALESFPHQFSGGMKQRIVIAMALANAPRLLIADEPTTALDVTIQAQVLDLIKELQATRDMAVMLISHDLGVVNEVADRVGVMYAGQIVEHGSRDAFFRRPLHPYSQKLFLSMPGIAKRNQALDVIPGMVPSLNDNFEGCRFVRRCHRALDLCARQQPEWSGSPDSRVLCHLYRDDGTPVEWRAKPVAAQSSAESSATSDGDALLCVRGLKVHFPVKSGIFKRVTGHIRAVDGVDIDIPKGGTLALVGESGCGKTTTGKGILQLVKPTSGRIVFDGKDLAQMPASSLRRKRSDFQIIFQDPYSAMNPRMLVADAVAEGWRSNDSGASTPDLVANLLQQVGLPVESAQRYPHEFSGGQRQRISIARAIAVKPKLIVCDEPTSALDLSVQAQILNLLKDLQRQMRVSYLFITHDISVVAYIAHFVAVMYLGRIVEYGPVDKILSSPRHPYTQALLSAVPTLDTGNKRQVIRLGGDVPSPSNPPSGCYFHPRCNQALSSCRVHYPRVSRIAKHHVTACHLYQPQE